MAGEKKCVWGYSRQGVLLEAQEATINGCGTCSVLDCLVQAILRDKSKTFCYVGELQNRTLSNVARFRLKLDENRESDAR